MDQVDWKTFSSVSMPVPHRVRSTYTTTMEDYDDFRFSEFEPLAVLGHGTTFKSGKKIFTDNQLDVANVDDYSVLSKHPDRQTHPLYNRNFIWCGGFSGLPDKIKRYGNLFFYTDDLSILCQPEFNFYVLEIVKYDSSQAIRIFITKENIPLMKRLDLTSSRSPIRYIYELEGGIVDSTKKSDTASTIRYIGGRCQMTLKIATTVQKPGSNWKYYTDFEILLEPGLLDLLDFTKVQPVISTMRPLVKDDEVVGKYPIFSGDSFWNLFYIVFFEKFSSQSKFSFKVPDKIPPEVCNIFKGFTGETSFIKGLDFDRVIEYCETNEKLDVLEFMMCLHDDIAVDMEKNLYNDSYEFRVWMFEAFSLARAVIGPQIQKMENDWDNIVSKFS